MGEACRKFDTPVTGGNVSFYNQNPDGAVYPTPTIGMVGLIEDVNDKMTMNFRTEGDLIYLIGKSSGDINSSEYLQKVKGVEFSPAPEFDINTEYEMQQILASVIKQGLIESAHDVSEGGLFITLLESSFNNNLGFDVVASDYNIRKDGFWFGEAQSRVVVSVKPGNEQAFKKAMGSHPYEELGVVTSSSIEVDGQEWGRISDWKYEYNTAIEKLLGVNANN
jgi:phosphoribosylformylglycinamidine synthase